jgi:hypothetical protein
LRSTWLKALNTYEIYGGAEDTHRPNPAMTSGLFRAFDTPLKISPERSSCQGEFANFDVKSQALQAPYMMADDVPPMTLIEVLAP